MQPSQFRRSRWERVAPPEIVDELEAEHAELDPDAQIAASAHVDEVGDADLAAEIADRLPADLDPDPDEQTGGEQQTAEGATEKTTRRRGQAQD